MHQPQVVEGQVGGRVGRGKCSERALGPPSDMEGASAALMFVLSTAPAHLLPLRMQGEEPTFPPSPAPRLQQAGLLPASASPTLTPPHHGVPVSGTDTIHQVAVPVSPPPPESLPQPGFSQATLTAPKSQTMTCASWPLSNLLSTYSVSNGTVLHALFPLIKKGSNYH